MIRTFSPQLRRSQPPSLLGDSAPTPLSERGAALSTQPDAALSTQPDAALSTQRSAASSARRGVALSLIRSETGVSLIEVLISSVLVALIAIATFTGFDASGRATATERAHSQADAIAQQWEDRLRGVQVSDIAALDKTHCVNDQGDDLGLSAPCPLSVAGYTGTIFTVHTVAQFVSDTSGTSSCGEKSQNADYIKTTSSVTWPGLGSRPAVSETSLVAPPISGELLVEDYNGANPISGVNVTETGPSPATTSSTQATGSNGCVIFTTLPTGEFTVSSNQVGYVDKNGNQEVSTTASLLAGSTAKVTMQYDRAGEIDVTFKNSAGSSVEGDTFVASNAEMTSPSFKTYGTVGSYKAAGVALKSGLKLFPFGTAGPPPTSNYAVYAGTCTANAPPTLPETTSAHVAPALATEVAVTMPTVTMALMSGNSGEPGKAVTKLIEGTLTDGCGVKRTFSETPGGALPHPALPYGTYTLCMTANVASAPKSPKGLKAGIRKYSLTFTSSSASGIALKELYLYDPILSTEGGTCP
jgi:Tfp pilus assembly protein PilV